MIALGCGAQPEIDLPDPGAHASGLLILIAPDEAPLLWAFDPAKGAPRFTTLEGTQAAVAFYDYPIGAFGLAEGRVSTVEAPRGRVLEPFAELFIADLAGPPAWSPVDETPKPFDELRFPSITPEECAADGGCYADVDAAAARACAIPCPADLPIDTPAEAAAPSPPILEPCPAGWTSAGGRCHPPAPCGPGQVRFAGDPTCHGIGSPCPADGLPPALAGGAVYVLPGSAGDGSRGAPVGTIGEALSLAPTGGAIGIGAGTYVEDVVVDSIDLIGACASGVNIDGFVALAGGATIADLSLAANRPLIVNGAVRAVDLILRGPLAVNGALAGERLLLSGPDAELASAIGSTATISEVVVEGGRVHVSGRLVLDRARLTACSGICLLATGAAVTLDDSVIEGSTHRGISADRSAIDLEDVVIRDTTDGPQPAGIWATSSTITARRVAILNAVEHAIRLEGSPLADLEDVVIRDIGRTIDTTTLPRTIGAAASNVTLRRVSIDRPTAIGIEISGPGAAHLEDVAIRDVVADNVYILDAVDPDGEGVVIRDGPDATLFRVSVERAHLGFMFYTTVDAEDLSASQLDAIRSPVTGNRYTGIGLRFVAGRSTVRRARVVNADRQSIDADRPDAMAILSDVVVEGPRGRAFRAHRLGTIELSRARISGTQSGICGELESRIVVTDLVVEDTVGDADPCPGNQVTPGVVLSVEPQGYLELDRFRLDGGVGPALLVSNPTSYRLLHGVVRDHPVGVRIDLNPTAFPLESFLVRVRYDGVPVPFDR